ncbi:MAG TPA: transcription termination/antitermination NusG family protein [Phycisphaerae bacterium]|jgi:transcriptional antiterminator RfaH|nr:transcription termination/antitermination NusG family protein [Phycisphaerae bacterium]
MDTHLQSSFPVDGFKPEGGGESPPSTARWYVLHTKSRQEKMVAEILGSLRIRYVLPLVQKNAYYGRRKVETELPLFPGYVFMHGELDQVYTADRSKRIANIIHVRDERTLEQELASLQLALANVNSFDPFPYLTKGVAVEVRAGPLQGVRGLIEDRTRRNRLILQVNILGQATSIEVDGSLLDVVE